MKRNERTIFNSLKKTVTDATIVVEIPMSFTLEGKQAIHELLTIQKHMYASVIGPSSHDHEPAIIYYPTRGVKHYDEIRMQQELALIDEIINSLPVTDYTWNGYKVEPAEPAEPAEPKRNIDELLPTMEYLLSSQKPWTWNDIDMIMSLSTGNLKLQSDDKIKFLIWSLPARKTCPFATGHCLAACYALKAERNYPAVLPAREYNFQLSQLDIFVPLMTRLFHEIAKKPAYKKALLTYVRIHESGDFYNMKYMHKWYQIAANCADLQTFRFVAYTKSLVYIQQLAKQGIFKPRNLIFRASVWDDTKPSQLALIDDLKLPIYTAFSPDHFPTDHALCKCDNCATCQMCFTEQVKKIACLIH